MANCGAASLGALKNPVARPVRQGAPGSCSDRAPFGASILFRLKQRSSHASSVKIHRICRRARLLPPGIVQSAAIDGIDAQLVDKFYDDGIGFSIIAGNRQGDVSKCAFRLAHSNKCFA